MKYHSTEFNTENKCNPKFKNYSKNTQTTNTRCFFWYILCTRLFKECTSEITASLKYSCYMVILNFATQVKYSQDNLVLSTGLIRSDEGLALEMSASESLYGGQFTLSTQLIKPSYLVILPPTQHHSFFIQIFTVQASPP